MDGNQSNTMSRPPIQSQKLNDSLYLSERYPDSECRTNNWWLHDKRAGMNLAMRAPTRDAAFVSVIEYWAKRSLKLEAELKELRSKVDSFVGQFAEPEEDKDY